MLVLLSACIAFGQDKKVAVLKPKVLQGDVSMNDKMIITASMNKAFTHINGYTAYTRMGQKFIAAEMEFQQSGMVADAKSLGGQDGADYICVFKLSLDGNELVVNSEIYSVSTGEIDRSDYEVLYDRTDRMKVDKQCQELAYRLLGVSGGSTSVQPRATSYTNTQRHPAEPVMVEVQGGTFWMGCTSEQQGSCDSDESPLHSVTLSSFKIAKYEVTQAQWQLLMGTSISQQQSKAGASSLYGVGDNYPMYYVSWNEAQEFISRLNAATGKNYRLPTEAEWEYAARGGNQSRGYKYSGSNFVEQVAWYGENSGSTTHPVGTKQPNELGIYDMSGKVWEWCYDWYGSYSSAQQRDPIGASSGSHRVFRGGSWSDDASSCRVADRSSRTPSLRNSHLGFRLVLP